MRLSENNLPYITTAERNYPANIYLFIVIYRNTEKMFKVNVEKHQEDIIDAVLVFLLLILNTFHISF